MPSEKDLFCGRDTYTTSLLAMCIDRFGVECIDWDPVTLRMELEAALKTPVPGYTEDKIQCGFSLLNSNLFKVSVEHFMVVCNTLSRGITITDSLTPPNVYDVAWAVTEASLLEGPEFNQEKFSHDIARTVGFLLDQEGIYEPIKALKFAEYKEGLLEANFLALADSDVDSAFYYSRQSDLKNAVNGAIQERMQALFTELKSLPLTNLNHAFVDDILNKLKRS